MLSAKILGLMAGLSGVATLIGLWLVVWWLPWLGALLAIIFGALSMFAD